MQLRFAVTWLSELSIGVPVDKKQSRTDPSPWDAALEMNRAQNLHTPISVAGVSQQRSGR